MVTTAGSGSPRLPLFGELLKAQRQLLGTALGVLGTGEARPPPKLLPFFQVGKSRTGRGSRPQVIEAISQAVVRTPGCVLLDVDAGPSTNRTVYTFVGRPEDVVDGALMPPAHFQAVNRLGLDSLSPFNPKERIIE